MGDFERLVTMADDVSADEHLGKAVRIRWTDSGMQSTQGWASIESWLADGNFNVLSVETVGMWMGENENAVCIASCHDAENENWMGIQTIWKPSILGVEWL